MSKSNDAETFVEVMHHTSMTLNTQSPRTLSGSLKRAALISCLIALQILPPVRAQSSLPALGDGAEMSLGDERRLGDRIAHELYRDTEYLEDPVLSQYVEGVWLRLMSAARLRGELSPEIEERFAWQVLLVRNSSVNAFALPGGYLGVHLGLVSVVASEDELASVLAHELSHVTQRHIVRLIARQGNQTPWLIGAMILGALAAASNPGAAGAVIVGGQAAAVQGQLNFSRDMEREADRVGYSVMSQAGFDPRGFVNMFEKLQQANRFNDTGNFPYLRSHPLTTERIADMQARQQLRAQDAPKPLTMVHAMMAARARALTRTDADGLRDALAQAQAPALASLSTPAQRAGALYAAVMAAAKLRDDARARALLGGLQQLTQADRAAQEQWRLLAAEVAMQAGGSKQALEIMGEPFSNDARPALLLRARAWTEQGQAARAAEALQVWLAGRPRDAQAWQTLSAAYDRQGLALRALRADAEAQAARQDYAAAQDRLHAAQELVRTGKATDHIEASIIDARSREMASLLREQALQR